MTKKWARKEAVQKSSSKLEKAMGWIRQHREQTIAIIISILVAAILAFYFLNRNKNLRQESWKELFILQEKISVEENFENKQKHFTDLSEFVKKYSNYPASAYMLISKGDILYDNGKYSEAVETYNEVAKSRHKKYIPFAANAVLYCYLAQKKEDVFITAAEKFVKNYPSHLLTPQVYVKLADVYNRQDKKEKAKEIYEKLVTDFSDSPWGQTARMILQTEKSKTENGNKVKEESK